MRIRIPKGARLAKGAKSAGNAFMAMGGGQLLPRKSSVLTLFGFIFFFILAFFIFSVLLSYV